MVFNSLKNAFSGKKPQIVVTPHYEKWREVVLKVDPGQVGVSADQPDQVFGLLMDIGMVDRQSQKPFALSLTAFVSGEASFQPTPGGGVVGLGGHEKIAEAARALAGYGQILLPHAKPTDDTSLPEPGFVQFIFLTTNGLRIYKEHLDTMQTPQNPFNQMLAGFGFIRQHAEGIIDQQRAKK